MGALTYLALEEASDVVNVCGPVGLHGPDGAVDQVPDDKNIIFKDGHMGLREWAPLHLVHPRCHADCL